ncbi:MAG: NADH-quinone oxidoreductase subunit J [Bacteroidetes bacterium]|jgi:NADH-quinone oxidoreductase subunit J|nr:NADH-quinone oxidoreductase subunit J [Bacteroidota bacterium]
MMLYLFAGLLCAALAYMLYSRQLVQSAFALFFVLIAQAALYVWASAPFLAAAQVLVYVGGVLVLMIFGGMLTALPALPDEAPATGRLLQLPAALLALGVLGILLTHFPGPETPVPHDLMAQNAQQLGYALVTDYVLPFELLSVLLLAALLGAAYLSRR